jgi:pimeloyl-ACP methyl ester carboxylesterase
MFYVFHAADEHPETKPLFVLFNGGPHFATTAGLLPFGTAPYVLDVTAPVGSAPVANPASLTRLGNLLYVDERMVGFSYGVGAPPQSCAFSSLDDATDFVRVVAAVTAKHPALRAAPLVLMGESYGGLRALEMAQLLATPTDDLADTISAWRAEGHGQSPRVAGIVLVQPLVVWSQFEAQKAIVANDPDLRNTTKREPYDVREQAGFEDSTLKPRVYGALASPSAVSMLLGVDLEAIVGLPATQRSGAARFPQDPSPVEATLAARLGAIAPGDAYFQLQTNACRVDLPSDPDAARGSAFLRALRAERLFITDARYDAVVHTPAIAAVLERAPGFRVSIDRESEPSLARPGELEVDLPATPDFPAMHAQIRFPRYESGHMVARTAGRELRDDIEAWLGKR